MKGVSRRDFLKYCIGSAAALGLDLSVVGRLQKALAAEGAGLPTVLWLNGANCTGCTVSLANRIASDAPRDVADLLVNTVRLAFHPNLMGAAGDLAVSTLRQAQESPYILAVDGGIPTAFEGHACILWSEEGREVTALEAVQTLAPNALAVLSIGTCASFGGIPGGSPNPTGIRTVSEASGVPAVHIPGCPAHPDWIVWTVAQLLAGSPPELDEDGRPVALFGERCNIHKNCPRKETEEAETFGVEGRCLKELGCKGPKTRADCYDRLWNNGTNWCIGANSICLGCTERGFPDRFSPFYDLEELGEGEGDRDRDRVTITKAAYNPDNGKLKIQAYTSFPYDSVTLTAEAVYAGTVVVLGPVPSDSTQEVFRLDACPSEVRVKSSAGGSAVQVLNGADTVTITKAAYNPDRGKLKIQAYTSFPYDSVALTAWALYNGDPVLLGRVPSNSDQEVFRLSDKPDQVRVTSTGGGSATATVQ